MKLNRKFKFKVNQQGLTLIEVLISITLLAFIAFAANTIVEQSFFETNMVTKEDRENVQLESALTRMESDLSQIFSPLYYSSPMVEGIYSSGNRGESKNNKEKYSRSSNFEAESQKGHPIPKFKNPDRQTFTFLTSANRRRIVNTKQSNFAWISYALLPMEKDQNQVSSDQVPNREGLFDIVRYFMADDIYQEDNFDFQKERPFRLLSNVRKMEFSFWDPAKTQFVPTLGAVKDGKNLLRGVRVEITWVNPAGVDEIYVKTFLPLWPILEIEDLKKIQKEVNDQAIKEYRKINKSK